MSWHLSLRDDGSTTRATPMMSCFPRHFRVAPSHPERQDRLRSVLAAGRIEPFFQPQIRISSGAVVGAEALARWRLESGEVAPPARFLPLAAREGVLTALDEAMLAAALDALARWRVLGLAIPRISVNASAGALRDPRFVDRLRHAVEMRDLGPGDVAIEVVESTLIDSDDDAAIRTVGRLSRCGFRVELDDFGSGHAAFANLLRLDLSAVKIDRSIIHRLTEDSRSEKVLKAVLRIAADLGLTTVAEGVETAEQLDALRAFGCGVAQGYLIARPMPVGETSRWLDRMWPQRLRPGARLSA